MAAPFQTDLFGLAAAVETTYGTDEGPTFASNAIRLAQEPDGPGEDYLAGNTREDEATGGLGGLAPAEPAGRFHEWTYRIIALGAGSAYTASNLPNIDPILQTIFSSTVDTTSGSETVTYTPSDAPETGVTLYTEKANKKYVTRGAVVQGLSVTLEAGQMPVWEVQMIGMADAPSEQALEAATYSTVDPPVFKAASVTINPGTDEGTSFTPVIRSATLDLGLEVAERGDGNATDAHAGYRIVRRRPTLTTTLEVEALTDYDPADLRAAISQIAFDLTAGGTQYERFDFDFDDMRVMNISGPQDQGGLQVYEVEHGLWTPGSGEEVTIVFD